MNVIARAFSVQRPPRTWNSFGFILLVALRHQGVPFVTLSPSSVLLVVGVRFPKNDDVHSGIPLNVLPVPENVAVVMSPSISVPVFFVNSPVMTTVLHSDRVAWNMSSLLNLAAAVFVALILVPVATAGPPAL